MEASINIYHLHNRLNLVDKYGESTIDFYLKYGLLKEEFYIIYKKIGEENFEKLCKIKEDLVPIVKECLIQVILEKENIKEYFDFIVEFARKIKSVRGYRKEELIELLSNESRLKVIYNHLKGVKEIYTIHLKYWYEEKIINLFEEFEKDLKYEINRLILDLDLWREEDILEVLKILREIRLRDISILRAFMEEYKFKSLEEFINKAEEILSLLRHN